MNQSTFVEVIKEMFNQERDVDMLLKIAEGLFGIKAGRA